MFFINHTATTHIYTLSLHDALPIYFVLLVAGQFSLDVQVVGIFANIHAVRRKAAAVRSEEHTSELQSLRHLVCRLLLEKKKNKKYTKIMIRNHIEDIIMRILFILVS